MLAERGVEVDHVSVYRWVRRFTTLLAETAKPCRHAVGDRWHFDETYVKVAGHWRYLYRAIDQFGQVVDVLLSSRRDARAAKRFFTKAMANSQSEPAEVIPTVPAPTWASSTSCSPPPSMTWSGSPTTSSRLTTAG